MKEFVNLPGRRHNLPFSDAVIVGETVYLSGRIGFTPGTFEVPADPKQEAHNLLDGFVAVLRECGLSMSDLTYVQIFTPDLTLFNVFNEVYASYFPDNSRMPARAFLGSGPLLFGARFEMIGIATRS